MVIASVAKFVNRIGRFDEQGILSVNEIVGYSIVLTGFGDIGHYKLVMTCQMLRCVVN